MVEVKFQYPTGIEILQKIFSTVSTLTNGTWIFEGQVRLFQQKFFYTKNVLKMFFGAVRQQKKRK